MMQLKSQFNDIEKSREQIAPKIPRSMRQTAKHLRNRAASGGTKDEKCDQQSLRGRGERAISVVID
jgi:hypothetical protein